MNERQQIGERVPDVVAADMVERLIEETFQRRQAGHPAELPDYLVINGHPYAIRDYL